MGRFTVHRFVCLAWVGLLTACEPPSTSSSTPPPNSGSGTPTTTNTPRVQTLKLAGAFGSHPRFSPDNRFIAYLRKDDSGEHVALMNSDGTGSKNLTSANYLTGFAWKADGSEFAATLGSLKWVSPVTGDVRPVSTTSNIGFAAMTPDLSPDEKTLVYAVNGSNLESVDLTKSPVVSTKQIFDATSPRFSPDGKWLAFVTREGKLTLLDLSTQETTELFEVKNFFASLDWLQDSKTLIVVTDRGIEKVTLGATPDRKLLSSDGAMDVDVSSDDKQIIYSINGLADLFVLTGF